jgi:SAM-dependent methyltransferase
VDLFERQWATYQILVEHNLMEHREITHAITSAIHEWLAQRDDQAQAIEMVDLGCGDLGQLAPLLRKLPLKKYVGIDLTKAVLPLAQSNLGSVPYSCVWEHGDLFKWACSMQNNHVDLIHSSFALHHLNQDQNCCFSRVRGSALRPMDYLFGPMSFVPIKNHEWNTSADIANESTNGLVSLRPKETPSLNTSKPMTFPPTAIGSSCKPKPRVGHSTGLGPVDTMLRL